MIGGVSWTRLVMIALIVVAVSLIYSLFYGEPRIPPNAHVPTTNYP